MGGEARTKMFSIRGLFRVCCVVVAIIATLYPIYLFNLNEDTVQIKFKQVYSDKNKIYPAMTFCFDTTKFYRFNQSSQNQLGVDIEHQVLSHQSTIDVEDYINNIVIKDMKNNRTRFTRAGVPIVADVKIKDKGLSINTVLRRYRSTNCFAIAIPFFNKRGINSMNVGIRKSIFNYGIAPTRNEIIHGRSQLNIGLSYQNQHFPLIARDATHLKEYDLMNKTCSGLIFKVRGMEMVCQRNKPSSPCNDYGHPDTVMALNKAAINIGCMPEGWEIVSTLPMCQSKMLNLTTRQLLDDSMYNANANQLVRPCRSIVDLWYENFDEPIDLCTDDPQTLHLTVIYNNLQVKEMKFVRKYTLFDLISSISLILGLFIGISLLQLPGVLDKAFDETKKTKNYIIHKVRRLSEHLEVQREMRNIETRIISLEQEKPLQRQTSAIYV